MGDYWKGVELYYVVKQLDIPSLELNEKNSHTIPCNNAKLWSKNQDAAHYTAVNHNYYGNA